MTRRIRETVLWAGAALGVLCLAWTAAMLAFGLTPLVFTSGSMSPEIKAGDLAFARTIGADDIAKGDVVSVINDKGTRITHRVVTVDRTDDGAVLSLKGDANATPDAEAYDVTEVQRVVFAVPKGGYVVNAANSGLGMFVGGLLVAAALFFAFGRGQGPVAPDRSPTDEEEPSDDDEADEEAGPTNTGRRITSLATVGTAVVALAVAGTMATVQPTQAAFSDTGTMTSGSVASHTVLPPVSLTCANVGSAGDAVRLSFPHRDLRYDYQVTVTRNSSGATQNAGGTVAGTGAVGTTLTSTIAAGMTPWQFLQPTTVQYTAHVWSRLKTSATWTSTELTASLYESRGLFQGYDLYCGTP